MKEKLQTAKQMIEKLQDYITLTSVEPKLKNGFSSEAVNTYLAELVKTINENAKNLQH